MNPDTPQRGLGRGSSSGRDPAENAAEPDMGSASFGSVFESGLGPTELSGEGEEGRGRDKARRLAGSVKEKATSQLNVQKARATDQLDNIARSVRQSTRKLRDENHEAVAAVLERGVNEMERWTTTLRERDVNEFLADIERFGRRQPALFLGTSLLAGVLLARFAKASDGESAGRSAGRSSRPGNSGYNPFNRPGDSFTGQESL